jgi:hypothetical protein
VFVIARANVAQMLMRQDRFDDALEILDETVPLVDAYAAEHADEVEARMSAMHMRPLRAETYIGLARHAEAAEDLRDLRTREVPAVMRFNAVILFARCSRLAADDAQLDAAQRTELSAEYDEETLDALHWAVEGGFRDAGWLEEVRANDPLRSHPRFEEIVRPLRTSH